MGSLQLIFILSFFASSFLFPQSQSDSTKFGVGLNFTTLYRGTPELQLDYFLTRHIGISAGTGYVLRPMYSGKTNEIYSLNGSYFKLGVKLRSHSRTVKRPVVWYTQLLYIGSSFNEKGKKYFYEPDSSYVLNLGGFVHALAATIGFEWRFLKGLTYRMGVQTTTYISYKERIIRYSYWPGIGVVGWGGPPSAFPSQIVSGIVYKFGTTHTKSKKAK